MSNCYTVLPCRIFSYWIILLLLAGLVGCVEPYAPAVIDAPPSLLVVDGFINADGPTRIRLSRSAALNAQATPPVEAKARLLVEDQTGVVLYNLQETVPGTYDAPPAKLSTGRQYRLRITTAKGEQYASAYETAKLTPPIESITWQTQSNGFNFYLSTDDPGGKSRYYRWQYDETWEIRSPYRPSVEYYDEDIRPIRSPYPYPDKCWASEQSTKIILSNTAVLNEDRVKDFRIRLLPLKSSRLYLRYSILVRQQALTPEEYAYWDLLAKNTEKIGSLFDPQPSQLTGNIRRLDGDNAGELALGFVGVHSVTEKRIFVSYRELPEGIETLSGYEDCLPPDILNPYFGDPPPTEIEIKAFLFGAFSDPNYLPISFTQDGLAAKSRDCIDCRTRGSAIRPSFW